MNTTTAERVTDADGTAFEGEIREFIRKDIAPARRISTESSEFAVNSVNSLVQRVAGTSAGARNGPRAGAPGLAAT